jgi:hypothetical protein
MIRKRKTLANSTQQNWSVHLNRAAATAHRRVARLFERRILGEGEPGLDSCRRPFTPALDR